jgi:RNA polymerase sigma factor (sigma-70 family)
MEVNLNDKAAVVKQYHRMVWKMVQKLLRRDGVRDVWEEDDLFQEGVIALLQAAEMFEPERGVKFITYAWARVWGILRAKVQMSNGLIHVPSNYACKGEPQPYLREAMLAKNVRQFPVHDDGESMDVALPMAPAPEERSDQDDKRIAAILQSLHGLKERDRLIITLRFGLDGEPALTLAEIGKRVGFSKEVVRQRARYALRSLRGRVRYLLRKGLTPEMVEAIDALASADAAERMGLSA